MMRGILLMVLFALAGSGAVAQTNAPPVYPLPPPPPVVMSTPNGNDVPSRVDIFPDRATYCLHYGASIGVPSNQMDAYVKRCVRQP
jgi:hypothetical protein